MYAPLIGNNNITTFISINVLFGQDHVLSMQVSCTL